MTDIVIGLPIICAVGFVLGAGWSAVFHRHFPYGSLGFVFLAWTSAIVSTSIAWAWVYPLNLDVRAGIGVSISIAIIGYIVAIGRHAFATVELRPSLGAGWGVLACLAITCIALIPAVGSARSLSVAQQIGPDEVGYAVSAQAIAHGLTRPDVEHNLQEQLVGGTVEGSLNPRTNQVDKIPSLTAQVQNEFLTGADRWGFAGAVGSAVYLVGRSHLWSLLSLLSAFALLTTCLGIWACVRVVTKSAWAATFAAILVGLNVSLLNAWHEGALAQIWVLPAAVLLALPVIQLKKSRSGPISFAAVLGIACVLPAYNSGLIAYLAVLAVAFVLSLPLLKRDWWRQWCPIALGGIVGAIIVAPSSIAFVSTLFRNLRENSSAGWVVPHWANLSEAFGLVNMYDFATRSITSRSPWSLLLGGIGGALIGALVVGLLYHRRLKTDSILLSSTLIVGFGIYVQTRYVSPAIDYQYFKTIATLAPTGGLALGLALGKTLVPAPADTTLRRRMQLIRQASPIWVATFVVAGAVVIAGLSYIVEFRQLGSVVPVAYSNFANSPSSQSIFEEYNVLAPNTLASYALGSEVDLNWIGRYSGAPSTVLGSRASHPVALLVPEAKCPGFACLRGLAPGSVILREGGVGLVRLSPTSEELAHLTESMWLGWASMKARTLGGGNLPGLASSPGSVN
jgi:hypothetical protein